MSSNEISINTGHVQMHRLIHYISIASLALITGYLAQSLCTKANSGYKQCAVVYPTKSEPKNKNDNKYNGFAL